MFLQVIRDKHAAFQLDGDQLADRNDLIMQFFFAISARLANSFSPSSWMRFNRSAVSDLDSSPVHVRRPGLKASTEAVRGTSESPGCQTLRIPCTVRHNSDLTNEITFLTVVFFKMLIAVADHLGEAVVFADQIGDLIVKTISRLCGFHAGSHGLSARLPGG